MPGRHVSDRKNDQNDSPGDGKRADGDVHQGQDELAEKKKDKPDNGRCNDGKVNDAALSDGVFGFGKTDNKGQIADGVNDDE
jgi:hypothetical protein